MPKGVHRCFRLSLFALMMAVLSPSRGAQAQALIVSFSDLHSEYEGLDGFLRFYSAKRADFLREHPGGKVVVIANGDILGGSTWTGGGERGWLGVRVLGALVDGGATVLYALGNHDGLDWGLHDSSNGLAREQTAELIRRGVHVLGANVTLAADSSGLAVESSFDVRIGPHRRARFVGLWLEDFWRKSSFDPQGEVRLIEEVDDSFAAAHREFVRAELEGIDDVILFQHDGHERVGQLTRRLQTTPGSKLSFPLAFAAHDHTEVEKFVGATLVLDGQSMGSAWSVVLEAKANRDEAGGRLAMREFFDRGLPAAYAAAPIAGFLQGVASEARATVARATDDLKLESVVGFTQGLKAVKGDLKTGRGDAGTAIANVFAAAAGEVAAAHGLDPARAVGLLNSSGYRRERPVAPGRLLVKDLFSMLPFEASASVYQVSGPELRELYAGLRAWREAYDGHYTPQLSSNLREAPGLRLEGLGADGVWHDVGRGGTYAVGVDDFLARNGYRVEAWTRILGGRRPLAKFEQRALLARLAPQAFAAQSCRRLFRQPMAARR